MAAKYILHRKLSYMFTICEHWVYEGITNRAGEVVPWLWCMLIEYGHGTIMLPAKMYFFMNI